MFLATNMPFLNQRYDVHVHTYATLQELKSKVFTVNSQNRLSSPRKSFKNKFFFAKYDCFFFWRLMRAFWTTVRMGIRLRMSSTKELKMKEFAINSLDINQAIRIQVTIMLEIKSQKYIS